MTSPKWELIWSDEFEGAAGARPDPKKWMFDLGGQGWGNWELQYYTNNSENAALDGNSSLVISALRISDPIASGLRCWYGPCRYTSARLLTRGRFEFAFGRVEARLRVPYGQGMWPAFWMLGADIDENPWPQCGEIDIMEIIGREPQKIYGTIHGPGYSHRLGIGRSHVLSLGRLPNDHFHVFAIEWEPGEIRWDVDGEQFFSVTPKLLPPEKRWVFDHPFFLLLNVAVGGTWPGQPDQSTVFPQRMMVDYVRIYQAKDGPTAPKVINNQHNSEPKVDRISPSPNHQMRGRILQRLVPKGGIAAEIGVHKGEFTRMIIDLTEPAKLHLIDPWYLFGKEWKWAPQGNRLTVDALIGVLQAFDEELVNGSVVLHIGYDFDILPQFPDQYFDWVYLDTSHQYEQTKAELDLLKLKVKADGMITGDDWHTDPGHMHHGVCRAVRGFVESEPYEIIYASDKDKQWAVQRLRPK